MLQRRYVVAQPFSIAKDGLPRHRRGGAIPGGGPRLVRREPPRGAPRAPRRRGPLRRARGARVEPRALRRGLVGHLVALRVRRSWALPPLPGDLPRGGGTGRGAAAHRRDRARHGGADDHGARHRRAEGALPPAAPRSGRDLVPGLLGAGGRLRPRGRAHLRPVEPGGPAPMPAELVGQVLVEPRPDLVAEACLLGSVAEVHRARC